MESSVLYYLYVLQPRLPLLISLLFSAASCGAACMYARVLVPRLKPSSCNRINLIVLRTPAFTFRNGNWSWASFVSCLRFVSVEVVSAGVNHRTARSVVAPPHYCIAVACATSRYLWYPMHGWLDQIDMALARRLQRNQAPDKAWRFITQELTWYWNHPPPLWA